MYRDNGERKQPCQGDCQHTSCSACRYVRPQFVDCAASIRCSSPEDSQCLRRFGRCMRRQQCSRQWYPCNTNNRVRVNSNSNSRICSMPPTVSPQVHYILHNQYEKEKTPEDAWMLLSTTAWVSVLSVGDSTHEVRRQRMHGHQFAARFLVGRGRRCWRCAGPFTLRTVP